MQLKGYAMYTYITRPDTEYDPCWKTTIVCDKEERDRVTEACGIKFTRCDGEEWEQYGEYKVTLRRYCEGRGKAKGKENKQPKLYNADTGNEFSEEVIVGNGSKVVAQFNPYSWTYKNRKGVSGDLQLLKVYELVEYVAPTDNEGVADADDPTSVEDLPEVDDDIKW